MTVEIPLYKGDKIIAVAVLDDEDWTLGRDRWYLNNHGYAVRTLRVHETSGQMYPRKTALLHRVVMGLDFGDPRQVDHIDRDRLNCCRSNLRILTIGQQAQNRRHPNPTGHRGVIAAASGRFYAKVGNKHLGTFDTVELAAETARAHRLATMPYAVD